MATRIDHSGHPHPSTPAARALCRANGGTGSIVSTGGSVPKIPSDSGKPKVPVVSTKPLNKTPTPKPENKPPTSKPDAGKQQPTSQRPIIRQPLTSYMPGVTSSSGATPKDREKLRIQNALRAGASREFIVSKTTRLTPEEVNEEIDRLLVAYNVPSYVYPRRASGKPIPKISDVKRAPTPPATPSVPTPKPVPIDPKPTAGKRLTAAERRAAQATADALRTVKATVSVKPGVKNRVNRVLGIQSEQVGERLTRIKGVDSDLPAPDSAKGQQWSVQAGTQAVCDFNGRIHLHPNLEHHHAVLARSQASGWFTKGGGDPIENTIAHEMGHALLQDPKFTQGQRKRLHDAMVEELGLEPAGNNWYMNGSLTQLVQNPRNAAKIKSKVSKYAATNIDEFVAEVWADFTMNPKPGRVTKALGGIIKEIVAEGSWSDAQPKKGRRR